MVQLSVLQTAISALQSVLQEDLKANEIEVYYKALPLIWSYNGKKLPFVIVIFYVKIVL